MNEEYLRIEKAVRFLQRHLTDQPGLDAVARHVGLSPYHFQRLFRQWVGISPKRYLEHLTVDSAKRLLQQSNTILDTAHELGLSGPSRLHEQFISIEATTPGEFKTAWRGVEIHYGAATGPFGEMLIAQTARGICMLSFVNTQTKHRELDRLHRLYRQAVLKEDQALITATANAIFTRPYPEDKHIHLAVRGTNFQINVWRALMNIPAGRVNSYQQLARAIGKPKAVRAVANAVAANPVNLLIPCHRVLRTDGSLGGYRGGPALKQSLLQWESSARLDDIDQP